MAHGKKKHLLLLETPRKVVSAPDRASTVGEHAVCRSCTRPVVTGGGVQSLQHSHSLLTAVEAHWDLERGRGVYSRLLLDCAEVNKRRQGFPGRCVQGMVVCEERCCFFGLRF